MSRWLIASLVVLSAIIGIYFVNHQKLTNIEEEVSLSNQEGNMNITSSAFANNQAIPSKFTCDGNDINPELSFSEVPADTKSLVLIMDDPDAPAGTANPGWVHWLVFNIDPALTKIDENSVPQNAIQGYTDFGRSDYGGPCPHGGVHHYVFTLYALNLDKLSLDSNATKTDLLKAMDGHIINSGQLVGTYERN